MYYTYYYTVLCTAYGLVGACNVMAVLVQCAGQSTMLSMPADEVLCQQVCPYAS